jgi:hypothetical protein
MPLEDKLEVDDIVYHHASSHRRTTFDRTITMHDLMSPKEASL